MKKIMTFLSAGMTIGMLLTAGSANASAPVTEKYEKTHVVHKKSTTEKKLHAKSLHAKSLHAKSLHAKSLHAKSLHAKSLKIKETDTTMPKTGFGGASEQTE